MRYTIGGKIESAFIDTLECLFIASYQNKDEKLPTLHLAVRKTDILKFFLRVLWEIKALDNKKYLTISTEMEEVGRMLGGWKRGLESKLPRIGEGEPM